MRDEGNEEARVCSGHLLHGQSHPGVHLLQKQMGRSVSLPWSLQEGVGSDSPRLLSAAGRWNMSACAVGYGVFFFQELILPRSDKIGHIHGGMAVNRSLSYFFLSLFIF